MCTKTVYSPSDGEDQDNSGAPPKGIWEELRERKKLRKENNKRQDSSLITAGFAFVIFWLCSSFSSFLSTPAQIKLSEMCTQAISIGGVGFSASLAILAIITALPNQGFQDWLTQTGAKVGSPYGNLVFCLAITCYAQLGLLITALFFDVAGGERTLFNHPLSSMSNFTGALMGATLSGMLALAFSLQFTALRTVRQVALLYGMFAQVKGAETSAAPATGGAEGRPTADGGRSAPPSG